MTSLEERALRRDRRFAWRMVLLLAVGLVFGLFLFGQLTGSDLANCAAQKFEQRAQ